MVFSNFTPLTGVAGGSLIGLGAACLLLLSGDIMGASGIMNSFFLTPKKAVTDPTVAWKLVFIATFLLFSNTCLAAYFTDDDRLKNDPSIPVVSIAGYLLAGFFVGFGVKLGNGCTSGHGIAGMARFSKRSWASAMTFMPVGIITAVITAPDNKTFASGTKWLRSDDEAPEFFNRWIGLAVAGVFVLLASIALWNVRSSLLGINKTTNDQTADVEKAEEADHPTCNFELSDKSSDGGSNPEQPKKCETCCTTPECKEEEKRLTVRDGINKLFPGFLSGALFAAGLAISGMVQPSKVLGFLNLYLFAEGSYDPTLLTVMCSGVLISFISYQFVENFTFFPSSPYVRKAPIMASKFSVPCNSNAIDWKLLVGAACFGIGWGLGGLCPGPAMFLAAAGTLNVIIFWWPMYIVGAFLAEEVRNRF